jgi:hypothetical protein
MVKEEEAMSKVSKAVAAAVPFVTAAAAAAA